MVSIHFDYNSDGFAELGVEPAVGSLTLMLIALSSTNNITSPPSGWLPDADSSAGLSFEPSVGTCASGVFAEEASIKVVGVMRELVRDSSFCGRSKYESPSIVMGVV